MRRRMFRYLNRPGLEFVLGCACFISATFFIASVLLSPWNGVPAAPALTEPIAVGPPPALPPGQAPPCSSRDRWPSHAHQIRSASPRY